MTSYLLLRNNKEKGPFSLEELIQHGLKPYDLVWVNGKSAAWRYPGEIAELKEYSPAVEEQPYDRFFKKPSEEKKQVPVAVQQKENVVQQSTYIPRKSVFVTLPGQKQQQPASIKEQPVTGYEKYQPAVKETVMAETAAPTILITETPVTAEIKYSQPLDEIKEMYVKTLQDRKQKIAKKTYLNAAMKNAAVALAIVGVGILIGFAMKSNGNKPVTATENIIPQQVAILPADTTGPVLQEQPAQEQKDEEIPAEPAYEEPQPVIQDEMKKQELKEQKQSPLTAPASVPEKAITTTPKKEVVQPEKKFVPADEPSPGVEINARTGERNKKVRSETTEPTEKEIISEPVPKAVLKNNSLSKQVTVSSNDYQKVAFGGIRNLQLTVSNDSKYVLDNVVVELQYLKPSEQPLKTESIQFRSVAPGGTQTIRVPDTNRGIKVTYKITHILSVQSAKDMADL
ncbi:MAG: hypothetical protein J0L56_05840 [Chitinophagales bacterium]|nr:hypothetical protein [Chitinophagales bacterium]